MKAIVVTPSYNEKDNIADFIAQVLQVDPGVHVVIVDDSSPDGTGEIVRALTRQSPRVHLIERTAPRGRGFADREGMKYAIKEGFDYIFQMDADFSHSPADIPRFLAEIKKHDVVIGSRQIEGGRIVGRGFYRNMVTKLANAYVRLVLGLKPKDCTSGYRCYRREVLAALDLDSMVSPGPSLLEETLYACSQKKYNIHEIPVTFVDRKKGKSKLGFRELIQISLLILKIRFKR